MKTLCTVGFLLLIAVGCATMQAEGTATLRIECNVPEAAVLLDDAIFARAADVAKQGKAIRPGFYRVEIRHPDYYPYFAEFTVEEGGTAALRAELHPLLVN